MDLLYAEEFNLSCSKALSFLKQESRYFDLFKYTLVSWINQIITLRFKNDPLAILVEETLKGYASEKLNVQSLRVKSIIS